MDAYGIKKLINAEISSMQREYARMTGISMWLLDEEEQMFEERALAMEMDAGLLEYVDRTAASMNGGNHFEDIDYEGRGLWLGKRPVFVEHRIVGFCVLIQEKTDSGHPRECMQKAEFWMRMLQNFLDGQRQVLDLNKRVKGLEELEKTMEEEKERLQKENDYDELTKVYSRSYFYRKLEEMDKDESALPVSVVVGDVNNLKFTNDMFGHRHGDILLYQIAHILQEEAEYMKEETGHNFIVARCGGDEFNVLMPNTLRRESNYYCYRVNERLKKETECCLVPSISMGSAKKTEPAQSLHRLLETADAKMYASKREFKSSQDQFEELMEVLFARKYLTRESVDRKMLLVKEFTEYLDWDPQAVTNCVNLIHYQDVGLTVVPERIYRQDGEYTDRQWREIKKHPQLGMKLALVRSDLAPISEMMYQTHENYDGSGWPRGTSGGALHRVTLAVRIVTEYVDMELAQSAEQARSYIQKESGKIFEPQLAEKFIDFIEFYK